MATQLTAQLQALAASAGIDKTKRPKGRPSLLYEPHVAADIGVEDVYDAAIEGVHVIASCSACMLDASLTVCIVQHCCMSR